MFTCIQVAKQLHMTEHTIRYYTDKGLVPNVQRDHNNIRLFDETSLNWLRGVKFLKDSGMSIKAIKEYVDLCLEGDSTIQARYEIVLQQSLTAKAQLEEAKKRVDYLEKKLKHYQDIAEHRVTDDTNPEKWKENSVSKAC